MRPGEQRSAGNHQASAGRLGAFVVQSEIKHTVFAPSGERSPVTSGQVKQLSAELDERTRTTYGPSRIRRASGLADGVR